MRLLLDSSALIWWFARSPQLSSSAADNIENRTNEILVSAASLWEIGIKHRIGKFNAGPMLEQVPIWFKEERFTELPVFSEHALRATALPPHHKDPFDRMLAAQAHAENLQIVSNDRVFDFYGVSRLW